MNNGGYVLNKNLVPSLEPFILRMWLHMSRVELVVFPREPALSSLPYHSWMSEDHASRRCLLFLLVSCGQTSEGCHPLSFP